MFSSIGPLEIILIVVVLLVIFGPKRLPSLGKSLGTGMREFKESITGEDKQREDKQREEDTDATGRPALTQAQADAAQSSQAAEAAPERRA